MKKGSLKVKLVHSQLEALCGVYDALLTDGNYTPENAHEQLLYECAAAFRNKIGLFTQKDQAKYTVPVDSVEAIAFMQLWTSQPLTLPPYSAVAISHFISKIDSKHKQALHIYA